MGVNVRKMAYGGWPNCYEISNGEVGLIVTSDVGPRIMRFGFVDQQNLFKEYSDTLGKSGEPEWQLRGGHRIWLAPENYPRTYAPDNSPVRIEVLADGLAATQPTEPTTGIEKKISVRLSATGTNVEVVHELRNTLAWEVELAPWALTMMAPGGTAISGFPPRGTHPEMLAPTNPLVMWAFSDLTDPRLHFTKKYLILRQDPLNPEPTKLGLFNQHTWGAYLLGSDLFIKRTTNKPGPRYPDMGCSFEVFTRNDMLELETLGPIQRVEPGATAHHIEKWSLHGGVRIGGWNDRELDCNLGSLVPI